MEGCYNYYYLEHWRTFFYDSGYVRETLSDIGGGAALCADFLTQFFITPWLGCLVYVLLLAFIVWQTGKLLRSISGTHILLPLACLPAVALTILSFNVNYLNAGTVAMAMALPLANLQRKNGIKVRLAVALVGTLILYLVSGPVAMLFSVICLLSEIAVSPKSSWIFVSAPLLALLLGWSSLLAGWTPELKYALTPHGYFNLRLQAGSIVWLPWMLTLAAVAVACLWRLTGLEHKIVKWSVLGLSTVGLVAFTVIAPLKYIDTTQEQFKRLSSLAYREDWDAVSDVCASLPMKNFIHQNYLNLALAERGILGDCLFRYPNYDIMSIYVQGSKNPHIYALLSDVYWSMGHIALAQRYAFEANESLGGYSPRLLQRLVQTNEALGYDRVAEKYRRLLKKTLFYRQWAADYRTPELKRKCASIPDKFSGLGGLDIDLAEIICAAPEHKATALYLGSLYLLDRDITKFMAFLDRFYGTEALPEILPVAFQEAVALYAAGDSRILERFSIQPETVRRLSDYVNNNSSQKESFWYFYINKR